MKIPAAMRDMMARAARAANSTICLRTPTKIKIFFLMKGDIGDNVGEGEKERGEREERGERGERGGDGGRGERGEMGQSGGERERGSTCEFM